MSAQPEQEQWLSAATNLAKLGFILAALFGGADLVLTVMYGSVSNPNGAPGTTAHVDGVQSDEPIFEGSFDKKGIRIIARKLATAFLGASILVFPAAGLAHRFSKRWPRGRPAQDSNGDQK